MFTSLRHRGAVPGIRLLSTGGGGRSRLPLGDDEDPFALLGVGVHADEKEIKSRFYAKAKVLHPDVAGPGRNTRAEFARLVRSYEVLMDRNLRAEFLLRRRRQNGENAGAAAAAFRPNGTGGGSRRPSPVDEFNASIRRGRRAKVQKGARFYAEEEAAEAEAEAAWHRRRQQKAAESKSMAPGSEEEDWDLERAMAMLDGGLLGKLRQEYDDAIRFAYLGPTVAEGTIPWAFECEERRPINDGGGGDKGGAEASQPSTGVRHPHILQMTSGQQLLGYVEARAEGTPFVLPKVATQQEQQQQHDDGGEEAVTLRSPFSGLRSVEPGRHNYASLELTWQGAPLAEAVRLRDEGKGEDVIVVKILQQMRGVAHHHPSRELQEEEEEAPCYMVRGLDTAALLSQHVVEEVEVRSGQAQATQVLICHRTPLVRHLHVVSVHDRRVEARISRAWKPPSDLWHFPPRSPDHDTGGYYIERAEAEGERRRASLLHPAVYVMACAYRTLDREEEERRKAQARADGAAPRIVQLAQGLVQKLL